VAADQLRYSTLPVVEIAWEYGFESYYAFAKVFKRIAGMTPTAYRKSGLFFSFEPILLRERVDYVEEREQSERFHDVKVIRLWPMQVFGYLHISMQEEGIENEAYETVCQFIRSMNLQVSSFRVFGHDVELPTLDGSQRFGYRILISGVALPAVPECFHEDKIAGGLYAVRKTTNCSPETIIDNWDRLLSEWLPKSRFERAAHQYVEEFISYDGRLVRMNLFLPVERKKQQDRIEVVVMAEQHAWFYRCSGKNAQAEAERRLIDWQNGQGAGYRLWNGRYYVSFQYGLRGDNEYWWENGIVGGNPPMHMLANTAYKTFAPGLYACMVTGTYGTLTGVLELMHRWIAINRMYRMEEERQWYAEYHTFAGTNIEIDTIVKLYIPIKAKEKGKVDTFE
jgi:DNA gyrase inhibitor GyrI